MNFIFISPQFPHTYWEFCDRLKQNGVNVLGIADAPWDSLSRELRNTLTEYYKVDNLEDYNQVYRAVAYFAFKYGKIDWIESNNEYWLEQDAKLRTDFNVRSGIQSDQIAFIKEKSEMKRIYLEHNIPTARQFQAENGLYQARIFATETGYPLIGKPDVGVGAGGTHKIHNEEELVNFFQTVPNVEHYVIEEFISGDICSYDAVINSESKPLFESMTVWPPSIMDIVNKKLDLAYYVDREIPETLKAIGHKTVEAFGVRSRFVHLEFFRLDRDRGALGKKGDFVALEVNMRPAGGYTPDMINYAHSTDVYRIWADMIAYDKSQLASAYYHNGGNALSIPWKNEFYCGFASRRDCHNYEYSDDDVREKYKDKLVTCERMPEILSGAMGNQMFTIKLETYDEYLEFVEYVHKQVV